MNCANSLVQYARLLDKPKTVFKKGRNKALVENGEEGGGKGTGARNVGKSWGWNGREVRPDQATTVVGMAFLA